MRAVALLRTDARRTVRDPVMLILALLPPVLTVAYHVYGEAARVQLPRPDVVHLVATAVLLLLAPLMFGFVAGLMLLDERDEGVLQAVSVTPVGKDGFLAWRMALPVAWSAAMALLVLLLLRAPETGVAHAAALALLAGLQAPLLALFLGAFAANKVEGMALAKVGNLLVALGGLAVLLPGHWQWAAAPSPHFWLVRLLLSDPSGAPAGLLLAAAFAVHVLALAALTLAFRRRAG